MLNKHDYISYLLSAQTNYTCTELADHKAGLSHDAVSDRPAARFLRREGFTPSQLWEVVQPHIEDSKQAAILVDDSAEQAVLAFHRVGQASILRYGKQSCKIRRGRPTVQ